MVASSESSSKSDFTLSVKLADFGLAERLNVGVFEDGEAANSASYSRNGKAGTMGYAAPEIFEERRAENRAS